MELGERGFDALTFALAQPDREQRCGAVRRTVRARARLDDAADDRRATRLVETLAKVQRMARWRIGDVEARPVDAHRAVVRREHAQPPGEAVGVLSARHHVHVGHAAQLARRQRRVAGVLGKHPVVLLDIGEQQHRQPALALQQNVIDEVLHATRSHHRLGHEGHAQRAGACSATHQLVEQSHQRWLQR